MWPWDRDTQGIQCRKGFIQLAECWRVAGNTWLCQSRLIVPAASTSTQGEAMVTVAVEGAMAVVADMFAGTRLCLALIYVWERRGKCQSWDCLAWAGQGMERA